MRSPALHSWFIPAAAGAVLALAGCSSSAPGGTPSQSVEASGSAAPSPQPGEPDYIPPADEACDFMVGEDGRDYAAYTGNDLSGLLVVDDVEEVFDGGSTWSSLQPYFDRGGLLCAMEPPQPGEYAVFAWSPIEEAEREAVIGDLTGQGMTRTESEGGTILTDPNGYPAEQHIVTNAGWYYSTQERGAEFLRVVFED
jgi:hypothetical protein